MPPNTDATSSKLAIRLLSDLAGMQPGERAVLVADATSDQEALAAVFEALSAGSTEVVRMDPAAFLATDTGGEEELVVSLAAPLLTHTDALRHRLAAGARYVNLRGLTSDLLRQAGEVDFEALQDLTAKLAAALASAASIHVSDAAGTDLTMDLGENGLALSGVAREPGTVGGFPGGEAAIVPVPGTASGVIRDPAYIEGYAGSGSGCAIGVAQGVLELVPDSEAAKSLLDQVGPSGAGRTLGELGLGTNPVLAVSSPRTAKKRLGTVHFGIGDNQTFGGTNAARAHVDVILLRPTVTLPDETIIENGEFVWNT